MTEHFIILEGADCTGKTTLAGQLLQYLHDPVVKHFTYVPDVRKVTYEAVRDIGLPPRQHSHIFDRHWVSELIYSLVYRRETTDIQKLLNDCLWIYTYLLPFKPFYVVTCIDNMLQKKLYAASKDELYPADERVGLVNILYRQLITACIDVGLCNWTLYDFTEHKFSNVLVDIRYFYSHGVDSYINNTRLFYTAMESVVRLYEDT